MNSNKHHSMYAIAILAGLILTVLPGCGTPADRLMRTQIDLMNQMAAAMENDAPKATVTAITDQLIRTSEQAKKLNPTNQEIEALREKYAEAIDAVSKRIQAAALNRNFSNSPDSFMFPGMMGSGFRPNSRR